jgi:hypothetical protein
MPLRDRQIPERLYLYVVKEIRVRHLVNEMIDSVPVNKQKKIQAPGNLPAASQIFVLIPVLPVLSVLSDGISPRRRMKAALIDHIARFVRWSATVHNYCRSFEHRILKSTSSDLIKPVYSLSVEAI